jgi:hypothetical protein
MIARLSLLVLCAVAPLLAIQFSHELDLRHAREVEARENALRLAEHASGELDHIINHARALLGTLAALPSVREHDRIDCGRFVERVQKTFERYALIGAVDFDGVPFCSSTGSIVPRVADRPFFFRHVMDAGRFSVGEYTLGSGATGAVLTFAAPVLDDAGNPSGAVFASLDLGWLARYFDDLSLGLDAALAITDRTGTVLVRLPENNRFAGTRFSEVYWPQVYASAPGTAEVVDVDRIVRVLGFVPVTRPPEGLYVGVGLTKEHAFASIDQATTRRVVLIAAGLTSGLALAALVGRFLITRPSNRGRGRRRLISGALRSYIRVGRISPSRPT